MGLGKPHHVVHESFDSYVERKYTNPILLTIVLLFVGISLIYGGITGDFSKNYIEWGFFMLIIVYFIWFKQINGFFRKK